MNNDYSGDIRFFRSSLQDYITSLMEPMKEEFKRLESLPTQCQDEAMKKFLGKKHYKDTTPWKSPKFYGRAIIEIIALIYEQKNTPYVNVEDHEGPTLRLTKQFEERENNLYSLLNKLSSFIRLTPEILILDAAIHYAERKRFYDGASPDSTNIGLLTSSEIVSFLTELSTSHKKLFNTFIKCWSKRYEITLFREAFMGKDYQSATEYLNGTNGGSSAFSIEVTCVAKGLYKLSSLTDALQKGRKCKKIDHKYYVKYSDVMPNDFLKDIEAPHYSEDRLEEVKAELSAKQHLFSENEYNAIVGEEVPTIKQPVESPCPVKDTSNIYIEGDGTPSPTVIEETSLNKFASHFPGIQLKFKSDAVIDIITDYLAGIYIDDDPDVKALFKYRITGLGDISPELLDKKVIWYMKGKHPNDLNGFLYAISFNRSSYQDYVARFFEFAFGKDSTGQPMIKHIVIEPLTQHKNTKIIDALREYPELRNLF